MDNVDYLDRYVITPDDINFDEYLTEAEQAKIKPAQNYRQSLVDSYHNPEINIALELPWKKAKENKIELRPGELSIWAGINGHGKSLLLNYVLLGLMAQGEKSCIASLEMKPIQTLKRMARQFTGIAEPSIQSLDEFLNWLNLYFYDQVGTVNSKRMIAVVRYCVKELGITQIVIDSLMKCGIASDDYNQQKHFVDELSTIAKDHNVDIHLVAHSRKRETEHTQMDKFDVKGAGEITDMADNVFTVWRNKIKEVKLNNPKISEEDKKELQNKHDVILRCDKQRNGEREGSIGLYFNPDTLQYKPFAQANRMEADDWSNRNWK